MNNLDQAEHAICPRHGAITLHFKLWHYKNIFDELIINDIPVGCCPRCEQVLLVPQEGLDKAGIWQDPWVPVLMLKELYEAPTLDELKIYFQKQDATLFVKYHNGKEALAIEYKDKESGAVLLFNMGCRSFGWSCQELWSEWCAYQSWINWHTKCAQSLVNVYFNASLKNQKAFNHWLSAMDKRKPISEAIQVLPGCIIQRDTSHFLMSGSIWEDRPFMPLPLGDILSLTDACTKDACDPLRFRQYTQALRNLIIEKQRGELEECFNEKILLQASLYRL